MSNFIAGQWLLVSTESGDTPNPFTDSVTGNPIDPTLVQLIVAVNGGTPTTYTYGVGQTITRIGVGEYRATLDTTGKPGTWQVTWSSDPDGTTPQVCVAIQSTTFNVYSPTIA